jgi:holin-like protein
MVDSAPSSQHRLVRMWRGLVVLLIFDVAGELVVRGAGLPLPGPVLGLAALLVWLMVRKQAPRGVDDGAELMLRHLSLFFVPAAVGALYLTPRLAAEAVPILVSLVVSTLVGLVVAAWVFARLARRRGATAESA